MSQRTLRIPGTLKHTGEQSDASLQETVREHVERHPGLLFLADVLRAVHASPALRTPADFFAAFRPRDVMEAFAERPDLRVRTLKAITGGPTALLRRLPGSEVASQLELLAAEDLPEAERMVRAEADRSLSLHELYLKYVDPVDLAAYVPAGVLWAYEARDAWWTKEAPAIARALTASELRSIRRHAIMTDSEILDVLGDETFERHMPLAVRTSLREASRHAASEGRPFTDSDMFARASGGGRDLVDEMVESIPLPELREVIEQAARMIGAGGQDTGAEPAKIPITEAPLAAAQAAPAAARVGPKGAGTGLPPVAAKNAPGTKKGPPALPPPKSKTSASEDTQSDGPPQPDDDLSFLEEVTGVTGHG